MNRAKWRFQVFSFYIVFFLLLGIITSNANMARIYVQKIQAISYWSKKVTWFLLSLANAGALTFYNTCLRMKQKEVKNLSFDHEQ